MLGRTRIALFGIVVAAGLAMTPAAFARSHWNVGVNIGFPGISIGYANCCRGGRYYGGYAAPVYYGSAYYSPAYYPSYYYDSYPYYPARVEYYDSRPAYRGDRGYYRHGHDRDSRGYRDYGHRATYYDRDGDYRR